MGKAITVKIVEILILLGLSLVSDIRTYKIRNGITMTFVLVGVGTNILLNGLNGLKSSLGGIIMPFLLLIALYALRMLGAGDIKLFCAIGGIMGVEFGIYSVAYSFIAGGIIAGVLLVIRKNGLERIRYLAEYMKTCLLTFSLQPYGEFDEKGDGSKFRFAYAIMCGTLMQLAASRL